MARRRPEWSPDSKPPAATFYAKSIVVLRPAAIFAHCLERKTSRLIASDRATALKESAEERRRFVRDAGDLVRCLAIEFEIELALGSTVVPIAKEFELTPSQVSPRKRGASDGDANARRLPDDPALLCDRFGRGYDADRDETRPPFVLAREDENRIAFGDLLATIHRLLRAER